MDIINRKSATTLFVCCLMGAGFFLDSGTRRDGPAPVAIAAPPPVAVPDGVAAPSISLDDQPPALPPSPVAPAAAPLPPMATGNPAIAEGFRGRSAPLPGDHRAAAQAALAEDLGAILR